MGGAETVGDEEILYRRVLPEFYGAGEGGPSPNAFRPTTADTDGLSLWRARYKPPEEVAREGRPGKRYFIAALRAGDLRAVGLEVLPDRPQSEAGHCIIPELNWSTRKTTKSLEWQKKLAELCVMRGPFEARAGAAP